MSSHTIEDDASDFVSFLIVLVVVVVVVVVMVVPLGKISCRLMDPGSDT